MPTHTSSIGMYPVSVRTNTPAGKQGLPKVITSTGSIFAPSMSVTLPRCFYCGKRLVVTAIGYGSISEQERGVMPFNTPASSKPPEPENRLHRVGYEVLFLVGCEFIKIPPYCHWYSLYQHQSMCTARWTIGIHIPFSLSVQYDHLLPWLDCFPYDNGSKRFMQQSEQANHSFIILRGHFEGKLTRWNVKFLPFY